MNVRDFVLPNFPRSLLLAALTALALGAVGASPAKAQQQQGVTKATSPGTGPASPAHATASTSAAQKSVPAAKPALKGLTTGITVHGHWIIDVRNPDGTLAAHRDFENAIVSPGVGLLSNLLEGNFVPGGWQIELGGTNATQTPASAANPCGSGAFNADGSSNTSAFDSFCSLFEVAAGWSKTACPAGDSAFCQVSLVRSPTPNTPISSTPGATAIVLTGVFTVASTLSGTATIGTVGSYQWLCGNGTVTSGFPTPVECLLEVGTPNTTGGGPPAALFTVGILPTPVTSIAAGSTITVIVAFSFD